MSDDERLSVGATPPSMNVAKKRPGIGLRILLVVLQIVGLLGALILCAAGYAFDLGATFGPLVVLPWSVSWGALGTANTMRGILIFCVPVSPRPV